jgi:type II secretory pathway component GspD/PulD (secretin)
MRIRSVAAGLLAGFSLSAFAAPAVAPVPLPPAPKVSIPPLPVSSDSPGSAGTGIQTFGEGEPIAQFIRDTIGTISGKSYVIAPEVAQSDRLIVADLSHMKGDMLSVATAILDRMDIAVRPIAGVYVIDKKKDFEKGTDEQKVFIYKPKNRTVSDLQGYLNVFPDIAFSTSGGIAVKKSSTAATPVSSSSTGSAASSTGSTAFSSGSTSYTQTGGLFSQTNTDPAFLVAKGAPADVERLKSFLAQIDVPVPTAVIQAYIFEVTSTHHHESGVSIVASILGDKLNINVGEAMGGDKIQLGPSQFNAAVTALTSNSDVRLISSPVLTAADGQTAQANIGTSTPTLGNITTTNGSSQQSVNYQDAGDILSVTARVLEESVQLSISDEISSFETTQTGLTDTPTKVNRSFSSTITLQPGEAALLGGLQETQDTQTAQHGFLSWLGGKLSDKTNTQIVVLVKVSKT